MQSRVAATIAHLMHGYYDVGPSAEGRDRRDRQKLESPVTSVPVSRCRPPTDQGLGPTGVGTTPAVLDVKSRLDPGSHWALRG